jgi:hypothetical protein
MQSRVANFCRKWDKTVVKGAAQEPGPVRGCEEVHTGVFHEVLSIPGRYLNDHCLIRKDDQWHFFGIVGDAASNCKGVPGEISFAHATTNDLEGEWRLHEEVIQVSGVWPEMSHVYAPYVIEDEGGFYMLYTAADQKGTQRICLATSGDLFQWERYAGNPVIVPSIFWSKWPGFGLDTPDEGSFGGCRDPHAIRLKDGRFVAYWVSRLQERFGKNMVCVAASISHDLIHWQEIGPVFSMKAWHQPLTLEVESPCVVWKDGQYWLFFKHGWWTHFVASDSPFDFQGYEPQRLGYSHAAEVFFWDGQWWITHCKTDSDDFRQCRSDLSRGFFLGHLEWPKDGYPKLGGQ